jgi:hypothetical protein
MEMVLEAQGQDQAEVLRWPVAVPLGGRATASIKGVTTPPLPLTPTADIGPASFSCWLETGSLIWWVGLPFLLGREFTRRDRV